MQNIDVSDLPESIARAIEAMVQVLRQQHPPPAANGKTKDLPCWEGRVLGNLTREEIYDKYV